MSTKSYKIKNGGFRLEKKFNYNQFKNYFMIGLSLLAVYIHVGNFMFLTLPSVQFYAWHLMIGLILIFLQFPLVKKHPTKFLAVDWSFIILIAIISLYVIINFEQYMQVMQTNTPTIELYALGVIVTFLVLEASRRVLGNVLPIIAIVAIIYALFGGDLPGILGHRGYTLRRVVSTIFGDQGIYGVPIGTSATNVYLFLLFAAYLNVSGAADIFQNIAIALAGRKRGGPAKMAVIASAFFGSISGSCVANVVSTGSFTIPLMKRNGYPPRFAGAVEAVASTGGQIMPPVMGAAAFVLADIVGVSYSKVCLAAMLPAIMYYVCLFKMVDLEAIKHNLVGLSEDQLPDLHSSLKRGFKLFIPIGVLLFLLLVIETTPMVAAIWSTVSIIILGYLDSADRFNLKRLIDGAVDCSKSLGQVVSACATAGIVVAMFSLTGFGLKFSDFIVQIGGNNLVISLILSMIVCAILGMGLPTTAAYIVCATAIAPALVKLEVVPLAAHLFLLYFASLSAITPPVAVASYAASGIAQENSVKVSITAVKLGITGFILPFAFVLNPDYITFALDAQTLFTYISGLIVSISVAVLFQGYVEQKITMVERLLYIAIFMLVIQSNRISTISGIILFAILYGGRKIQSRKVLKSNQQA